MSGLTADPATVTGGGKMSDIVNKLRVLAGWDTATNEMTVREHVASKGADEIERLRAEVKELKTMDAHAEKTIERLRERIEELEVALPEWIYNKETGQIFVTTRGEVDKKTTHIITDSQIDAAWAHTSDGSSMLSARAHTVLETLGIVRCDWQTAEFECRGTEGTATRLPPEEYRQIPVCLECNGHGWIKTSPLVDKCGQFGTDDD